MYKLENEVYYLQGMENGFTSPKYNDWHKNVLSLLDSINFQIIEQEDYSLSEVIKKSKCFYNSHFSLPQIIAVRPEKKNAFKRRIESQVTKEEIIRTLNRYTYHISPFSLPVVYGKHSEVKLCVFDSMKPKPFHLFHRSLGENPNIANYYISLEDNVDLTTPFQYTHEIAHLAVSYHYGTIKNLHNEEFISILLEKIHAYESSLEEFNAIESFRLQTLRTNLRSFQAFWDNNVSYTFITSTIKAEILFHYYVVSNNSTKKAILQDIQKIFSGQITIDKFLKKYELLSDINPHATDSIKHNLQLKK